MSTRTREDDIKRIRSGAIVLAGDNYRLPYRMINPNESFSPRYPWHQLQPANPADQNPPCNTLYVGNLPTDTSEDELKAVFSKQRGYKRLYLGAQSSSPTCLVEFEDVSSATKTLKELYGHLLHNSVEGGIRLNFYRTQLYPNDQMSVHSSMSPTASKQEPTRSKQGWLSEASLHPEKTTTDHPQSRLTDSVQSKLLCQLGSTTTGLWDLTIQSVDAVKLDKTNFLLDIVAIYGTGGSAMTEVYSGLKILNDFMHAAEPRIQMLTYGYVATEDLKYPIDQFSEHLLLNLKHARRTHSQAVYIAHTSTEPEDRELYHAIRQLIFLGATPGLRDPTFCNIDVHTLSGGRRIEQDKDRYPTPASLTDRISGPSSPTAAEAEVMTFADVDEIVCDRVHDILSMLVEKERVIDLLVNFSKGLEPLPNQWVQELINSRKNLEQLLDQWVQERAVAKLLLLVQYSLKTFQSTFPWVVDLVDDQDMENFEIVYLLLKSEHLQWITDPSFTFDDSKSSPPANGHLPGCAHGLMSKLFNPDKREEDPQHGPPALPRTSIEESMSLPLRLETREQRMLEICGLAGVFPPRSRDDRHNAGFAMFDRGTAKIGYGDYSLPYEQNSGNAAMNDLAGHFDNASIIHDYHDYHFALDLPSSSQVQMPPARSYVTWVEPQKEELKSRGIENTGSIRFSDYTEAPEQGVRPSKTSKVHGALEDATFTKLPCWVYSTEILDEHGERYTTYNHEVTGAKMICVLRDVDKKTLEKYEQQSKDLRVRTAVEQTLAPKIRAAFDNIIKGVKILHMEKGCCDHFSVLTRIVASNTCVTLHPVKLTSLIAIRDCLQSWWRAPDVVSVASRRRGLLRACTDFIEDFGWTFGLSPYLMAKRTDMFHPRRCLHIAALIAQICSLGLATYSRGHSQDFQHPLLSRDVEQFVLLGSDPDGPTVLVERVELNCLGRMLGRKVWVFTPTDSLPEERPTQVLSPSKYYLSSSLETLLDTWGGYVVCRDRNLKMDSAEVMIKIGGGTIQVSKEGPNLHHWERGMQDHYTTLYASKTQFVIGTTIVNAACELNYAACMSRIPANALQTMGTRSPQWKWRQRQAGIGVGQFGSGVMTLVQEKDDGKSVKQRLMEVWESSGDIRILNCLFGLEMSLCTGVARRVKLREFFYGPILTYLRYSLPQDWATVSAIAEKLPDMTDEEFYDCQETLTSEQSDVLKKVVEQLLLALEPTGVEQDGHTLLLWWPEENLAAQRGLRITKKQYSGTTPWISMLAESGSCAVFALATARCLQHHDIKQCRNPQSPPNLAEIKDVVLDTTLIPATTRFDAPPLLYTVGSRYYVWKRQELLRVKRSVVPGDDVVRLSYSTHIYPRIVLKKLVEKCPEVREREVASGQEQKVLLL